MLSFPDDFIMCKLFRPDGVFAVPDENEWPICKTKTTTAKPRN